MEAKQLLGLWIVFLMISSPVALAEDPDAEPGDEVNFDFSQFARPPPQSPPQVFATASTPTTLQSTPHRVDPTAVNTLSSEVTTNLFTGSVGYTYGIEVPPGVGGFQPALALSYNHHSAGREGIAGAGWSLTTNAILRDPNATRSDESDDYFMIHLNGVSDRLVYAPSENLYHTEHESFMNIKRETGGQNDLGDYWIVKTKDGTSYRFGFNTNSEQVSNLENYVSRWSLDQIEETHGNTINYGYEEDPASDVGSVYLSFIEYGLNRIDLTYDHSLRKITEQFIQGNRVTETGVLRQILVQHNTQPVRMYELSYNSPAVDEVIQLTTIQEFGSDLTSTLPPVEFTYESLDQNWQEDAAWELPPGVELGSNEDQGARLVDMNGDGRTDILKIFGDTDTVAFWENAGTGFAQRVDFQLNNLDSFVTDAGVDQGLRFMDINGDTKIDLVQLTSGPHVRRQVFLGTGGNFVKDTQISIPSDISFVSTTTFPACVPNGCPGGFHEETEICSGFSCSSQNPVVCSRDECTRRCVRETCSQSGSTVYNQIREHPRWNDDGHEEEDDGIDYRPRTDKCYMFEYTGSDDTDGDDSECYDLYTDDDFENDEYDNDCDGRDIDAYAGVGFVANANDNSWLSTLPHGNDFGWIGNADDRDWEYRYYSETDRDTRPDETGGNAGDWDAFDFTICDEAGAHQIYCAPSPEACQQWGKGRCGFGCGNERTGPFVNLGVFISVTDSFNDALNDFWECGTIDDNDYYGYGRFRVLEFNMQISRADQTCTYIPFVSRTTGTIAVDINGDGYSDFVKGAHNEQRTWINNDGSFTEQPIWRIPSGAHFIDENQTSRGVRMTDITADGLPDIVHADENVREVWINTGEGFEPKPTWNIPTEIIFVEDEQETAFTLIDVNADGFTDVVGSDPGTVWINTGSGWEENTQWSIPSEVNLTGFSTQAADLNSDATIDFVYGKSDTEKKTFTNNADRTFLLKRVDNGQGGSTLITYQEIPLIDNSGPDDIDDLSFSGWVVNSVTQNNGMMGTQHITSTTQFTYKDGLFDPEERDFRGFAYVGEERADGTLIKHFFHQDKGRKGLEHTTQVENNILFQETRNQFSATEQDGYFVIQLDAQEVELVNPHDTSFTRTMQTAYEYDAYGNVERITRGDPADPTQNIVQEFQFVHNVQDWIVDRVATSKLLDGGTVLRETKFAYDTRNHLQPPTQGDLTRRTDVAAVSAVQRFTYDAFGNVIEAIDPEQNSMTYEYDSTNTFVIKETNALNQETQYMYNSGTGDLLSVEDPNGFTTTFTYDVFGREIARVLPFDTAQLPTEITEYETDGNAPESITIKKREVSGQTSTYDIITYVDGFGNELQVKSDGTNGDFITVDSQYDNLFRRISVSNAYTTPNHLHSAPTSQPETIWTYDPLGRVTVITNQDGTQYQTIYTERAVFTLDESGHRTEQDLDTHGRIIEVREFEDQQIFTTEYTYDAAGEVTEVEDDQGNLIQFTYDLLGRKTQLTDPDLGTWVYAYDRAGNLIEQTDTAGNFIDLTYDPLHRLETKTVSTTVHTYVYDQPTVGALTSVQTPDVTTSYLYDDRLRTTHETRAIDNISFTTEFEYDALDRLTEKTHPDGTVVRFNYDEANELSGIPGIVPVIERDEHGLITKRMYSNNLDTRFTYDDRFRMKSIRTGSLQDLDYKLDNVGNIERLDDFSQSTQEFYTYDERDRLLTATKNQGTTQLYAMGYTYDSIGNLLQVVGSNYTISMSYDAHAVTTIDTNREACRVETDCGTDGFITGNYCDNDDVKSMYRDFSCNQGFCSVEEREQIVDDCSSSENCFDAQCLREVCQDNNDCGRTGFNNNPFCSGNAVYRDFEQHNCVDTGTRCTGFQEEQIIHSCPFGCTSGACIGQASCADTDGIDFFTKGTADGHQDYCVEVGIGSRSRVNSCSGSNCFVVEQYCSGNDHETSTFNCANGCDDGACNPQTQAPLDFGSFSPSQPTLTMNEGDSIQFRVTASGPTRFEWYVSGTLVSTFQDFLYEPGFDDAGTHEIRVVAKRGTEQISHEWEVVVTDQSVALLPDLRVREFEVSLPANPVAGQPVFFRFVVHNVGSVNARDVAWRIDTGDGSVVDSLDLLKMDINEQSVITAQYTYSNPGTYQVTAIADFDDSIAELDESNNEETITIQVG